MSQDIIERLREYKDILYPEAHEAADTIESLRARVAELEAEADPEALHIAYLHGQADRNQQLAAQALMIKTMREVIRGMSFGADWNHGTHAKIYRNKLLSFLDIPDNSTEVLQAWLDKQLGEPVAFKDKEARNRVIFPPAKPEANDARWDALYRKPEIK